MAAYAPSMRIETSPAEISVALLTVSDRSHRGEREDHSGPAAAEALAAAGFDVMGNTVIPDGRNSVEGAIWEAIQQGADVILTLGGTGVGPRDESPEGTRQLLQLELPGIAEGLRSAGAGKLPTAVLSRGLAGVSKPSPAGQRSIVVNLPGSAGGARDGIDYLTPILPHLIDQLRGGDH